MQQTTIDRWLLKKFIHVNHIYCNTLPEKLPLGLLVEEAPEESGGRYLYKLTTRSEELVSELAQVLSMSNITYTSRVEDREVWFSRFLNDPHKSFTYRVVWMLIGLAGLIFSVSGMPQYLWSKLNEEEVGEVVEKTEEAKVYHKRDGLYEIDRKQ